MTETRLLSILSGDVRRHRIAWSASLPNLHAALDRAVWAAYRWDDDDPATVEEDVILARLLALDLERAADRVSEQRASAPPPD